MSNDRPPATSSEAGFREAHKEPQLSLFTEFLLFLRDNKKWWLLPIVIVLGMFGTLMVWAASSGAAPFIYSLF